VGRADVAHDRLPKTGKTGKTRQNIQKPAKNTKTDKTGQDKLYHIRSSIVARI